MFFTFIPHELKKLNDDFFSQFVCIYHKQVNDSPGVRNCKHCNCSANKNTCSYSLVKNHPKAHLTQRKHSVLIQKSWINVAKQKCKVGFWLNKYNPVKYNKQLKASTDCGPRTYTLGYNSYGHTRYIRFWTWAILKYDAIYGVNSL